MIVYILISFYLIGDDVQSSISPNWLGSHWPGWNLESVKIHNDHAAS